jgi:hypothetical protein
MSGTVDLILINVIWRSPLQIILLGHQGNEFGIEGRLAKWPPDIRRMARIWLSILKVATAARR